jgi:hypothetical protein
MRLGRQLFIAIAVSAILSACAKDPSRIEAFAVPPDQFAAMDCAAIQTALADREPRLTQLAVAQEKRATADGASAILIGITPSMFDSPASREAEIGKLKGEVNALRADGATKSCALPAQDPALVEALAPARPVEQQHR